MNKNSRGILNVMLLISESFKRIDIDNEGIIKVLDNHLFINLFDAVPDKRQEGKVKYKLSNLLIMIILTVIRRGKMSHVDIAYTIEANRDLYRQYDLLPEDGSCPSHDTIRRVLTLLDGDVLYKTTIEELYNFLEKIRDAYALQGDYRHICIDGKEMRGSGRSKNTNNPKRNTAMLNVYEASSYTAIECTPIDTKENEIPVCQSIIKDMDLKETIITADALHCQKETINIINNNKGVYVLTVKDNQKLLLQDIEARFSSFSKRIKVIENDEIIIETLELPKNYCLKDEWSGLKCYVKMQSKKCSRYFITNTADPLLIKQAIAMRWSIETFHKLKDYDLGEDAIRSTDQKVLRNIAILNNLSEQLFTLYQAITGLQHRQAKVHFQERPIDCLNVVLSVINSQEINDLLIKDVKKRRRARTTKTK